MILGKSDKSYMTGTDGTVQNGVKTKEIKNIQQDLQQHSSLHCKAYNNTAHNYTARPTTTQLTTTLQGLQ